jgi:hypothetical protein
MIVFTKYSDSVFSNQEKNADPSGTRKSVADSFRPKPEFATEGEGEVGIGADAERSGRDGEPEPPPPCGTGCPHQTHTPG